MPSGHAHTHHPRHHEAAGRGGAVRTTNRVPKTMKKQTIYKCPYEGCEMESTRKYNVEAHMRKHTGATPYPCEYHCGEAFRWKTSRDLHMKKVHGGSGGQSSAPSWSAKGSRIGDIPEYQANPVPVRRTVPELPPTMMTKATIPNVANGDRARQFEDFQRQYEEVPQAYEDLARPNEDPQRQYVAEIPPVASEDVARNYLPEASQTSYAYPPKQNTQPSALYSMTLDNLDEELDNVLAEDVYDTNSYQSLLSFDTLPLADEFASMPNLRLNMPNHGSSSLNLNFRPERAWNAE